jgi:hypothetical protein
MATTAQDGDRQQLRRLRRTPKGRITLIVVASLAAGLVAAFALVVWIVIRARQQLRSRTRQWLLYPLLAVLAALRAEQSVRSRRDGR